jgi:phenylpropionate dioxygenase-like ring-hydroxylating dioxygenase large terminal subunit
MILLFLICITAVNGYGWVPLCDLKTYNTKKPSEIRVLDKTLVLWEKSGNIVVQDNVCLHRGAPLSEGYIDKTTQNLRCSYHGWEFSPTGKVLSIPQAYSECNTCPYSQKTYQTHTSCNILWVNLNDSSIPFPLHISENEQFVCDDTFAIEIPYSMNILLENLFDPAHVPFAHHKLQSFRDLASSVNSSIIVSNETMLQILFEDSTLANNHYRNGTMTFFSPNHYVLTSLYPNTFIKKLHVYCVPVLPYKTRIFVQNEYESFTDYQQINSFYISILNSLPHWVKHLVTHTFFDSDTMLLYKQEQMLRFKNMLGNCTYTYHTPTSSDYSIHAFHRWKNKYSQEWFQRIMENAESTNSLSRKEVFDRYNDHTKHCIACSGTLKTVKQLQLILPILLISHGISFGSGQEILFSAVIFFILDKLKSMFIHKDYIHNEL